MAGGELPTAKMKCDACGAAFRVRLKKGRVPSKPVPCPKCKAPIRITEDDVQRPAAVSQREMVKAELRSTQGMAGTLRETIVASATKVRDRLEPAQKFLRTVVPAAKVFGINKSAKIGGAKPSDGAAKSKERSSSVAGGTFHIHGRDDTKREQVNTPTPGGHASRGVPIGRLRPREDTPEPKRRPATPAPRARNTPVPTTADKKPSISGLSIPRPSSIPRPEKKERSTANVSALSLPTPSLPPPARGKTVDPPGDVAADGPGDLEAPESVDSEELEALDSEALEELDSEALEELEVDGQTGDETADADPRPSVPPPRKPVEPVAEPPPADPSSSAPVDPVDAEDPHPAVVEPSSDDVMNTDELVDFSMELIAEDGDEDVQLPPMTFGAALVLWATILAVVAALVVLALWVIGSLT